VLYFASDKRTNLKTFWEKELRAHVRTVAAIIGQDSLPASSSLSRALEASEFALVRDAASFLLTDLPEADKVLRHSVVQSFDACARPWHVFDLDPTVTTLHQRPLPDGEDLPEPLRLVTEMGDLGHKGRKRGDLVFRQVRVQHAGSGLWRHVHLSPGNGAGVFDFAPALDSVVADCERLGHPRERAVVRMDGEFGSVPYFTECREHQLPFVTRLNRANFFDDLEVLRRLRRATFYRVPNSLAGPERSACELGVLTVQPGKDTRRPDGSRYAPVKVRVVATRFEKRGKAKRGRKLDGYQVELFAIDLPVDAWPAPQAIASYFGRSGQENRFAQEDRELGLDRIISYNLPGQELASLIALSLWNLRVVQGFELDEVPDVAPVQQPLRVEVVESSTQGWPADPVVAKTLSQLDWESLLQKRPGWFWDEARAQLLCESGRPLSMTTVRPCEIAPGRTCIIFCRPSGGCQDCEARPGCLRSGNPVACKHLEMSVPTGLAGELRKRLTETRDPASGIEVPISAESWGPFDVRESLFLPARARQGLEALMERASLKIDVVPGPRAAPRPRLVALDDADRQRRRKTWPQNLRRYAMPLGTRVQIKLAGRDALHDWLGFSASKGARKERAA
jgi:hypothetical protein